MKTQKLLLTHYKGRETAFLLEHDRLIQVLLAASSPYSIGDIYVGRVKNIVKGMDAAFVELAPGSVGFLPFSHFNPKTVLNRPQAEQIRCGDEILVQVSKEPHKTKEATLTTDISFSGRYLVLIPYSQGIHYSKKLDTKTKEHLRTEIAEVALQLFGEMDVFLQHYGLIVRTNAQDAPKQEIAQELHDLFHKAGDVVSVADKRTVFSCLYKEEEFFERVLNNYYLSGQTQVVTDDAKIFERVTKQSLLHPEPGDSLRLYEDARISMQSLYGLEEKIKEALSKKVWLKCGGYLIIEPTETMTVIDVNSGKSDKSKNKLSPDEFHHRVNCDAAAEILRQLRLRNLSGIIIVDFLKTTEEYSRTLLDTLREEARKDPVQTVVVDMTALGLVEITRKKTEASLYEKLKTTEL